MLCPGDTGVSVGHPGDELVALGIGHSLIPGHRTEWDQSQLGTVPTPPPPAGVAIHLCASQHESGFAVVTKYPHSLF